MHKVWVAAVFAFLLAASAAARPVEGTDRLPRVMMLDPANPAGDLTPGRFAGVLGTAQQETTYFGGTVWAADSMRWEAIEGGVWTFDSGVGSDFLNFTPDVNPFKDPALHTHMEGWVGVDNSYGGTNPYFRRLADGDPGWAPVCVGALGGLGGHWSFWCGVLASESGVACFAAGQGYGNVWVVSIEKGFAYAGGSLTLSYDYTNDTEPGYDYSTVYVDTTGAGDRVAVAQYDGYVASGTETLNLIPGVNLPAGAGPIKVLFEFMADGAYSDQDGAWPTACGAFAVDDIAVGADVSDFEAGANGWALSPPSEGQGEEWSDLWALSDLPAPLTPCACVFVDSVLAFVNTTVGSGGHNLYTDNIAASPWIDLKAAGLDGSPFKFIQTAIYAELPLLNYIFVQFSMQWYPTVCAQNGKLVTSAFESNGFVYYFAGVPTCTTSLLTPTRIGGHPIDAGAEQVRIAVGPLSYCRFYGNCTGVTNTTPWFDFVRLGVYGLPDAPYLTASATKTLPQDSFPQNGTLRLDAPGRVDCNLVKGFATPEPFSSLGDTLVVDGGTGGAEVRVQFAVRPGPFAADNPAFTAWLSSHQMENVWEGQQWYSARMDTAEQGGVKPSSPGFMTAYHEGDPNFSGTDRDASGDPAITGQNRLDNDIFRDDLLTGGSRLNLFYKAQYDGSDPAHPWNGVWFLLPDTTGGVCYEMEVLPSSMAADSTWNCVLYVDHFNRGAQEVIEPALRSVLAGVSTNFEGTPWDRYDVNAESSQQGSFGRPVSTDYNCTVNQSFAYKAIVWTSGNLNSFNLVEEDANVLIPWLTLLDPGLGFNNLYLSGDGIAASMHGEAATDPSAKTLLNTWIGATYTCGTVRAANCPTGSPEALDACIGVDPVGGWFTGNDGPGTVKLEGNGCPQLRSFDLLGVSGSAAGAPAGNEIYAIKGGIEFASVANAESGGPDYKAVIDGASIHYRRDAACGDPIAVVADRLSRVLGWFGAEGGAQSCQDPPPPCQWCGPGFLSSVPDCLILTPDGTYENIIVVNDERGPLPGALVEVRVHAAADTLIRWAAGQAHPRMFAVTDSNGVARISIAGGFCVPPGSIHGVTTICAVFADGIELDRVELGSPDVVNDLGQRVTDPGFEECGGMRVTLADLEYHRSHLGIANFCSNFTAPYNDPVDSTDIAFAESYYGMSATPEEEWPDCEGLGTEETLPARNSLGQNAPNPFASTTRIRFELKQATSTRVIIHDIAGRRVRTLADGVYPAGGHDVEWDGRDDAGRSLAPGIYFYRVEAGEFTDSRKLVLLRR